MMFVIAFIVLFLPMTIFFPTRVIHKERMPKKKKCIATSNHYSNTDGLVYISKFARKFRFMTKKELFNNKLAGAFFESLGMFPVDRKQITPSVFKRTMSELEKNHTVFIFPEGTRNKEDTEQMGDVKSGVITFALKGDAEIVSMVMYRKPKFLRQNYIIVGEPFKVQGENPKRLTKQEVEQNVEKYVEVMNNLRIELDEYVASRHKKKKHKENK